MSGEQIRLQVPPKLCRVHSLITQIIRQWVPNCRAATEKARVPKVLRTALNTWNRQLMTLLSPSPPLFRPSLCSRARPGNSLTSWWRHRHCRDFPLTAANSYKL